MAFRIRGLSPEPFQPLFGLSEEELATRGARRYSVDANPGFPDRISLRDLELGESANLINFEHQPIGPYASRHAVFVAEGGGQAYDAVDTIPQSLWLRPISLRAFDHDHMMVDADLTQGDGLAPLIEKLLANPQVSYLHAHFARRGCYAARLDRT
jgi:hypothetical protein